MKRRLLNFATVLSLLVLAATLAVWARSYVTGDRFFRWRFERDGGYTFWTSESVSVGRGGVGYSRFVQSHLHDDYPDQRAKLARGEPPRHMRVKPAYPASATSVRGSANRLGFQCDHWSRGRTESGRPRVVSLDLVFPIWCIAVPAAALPLVRGWKRWRRRRTPAGRCPECGYDLRASPGRCPECGADTLTGS
ncbi:MAG TPA: hypothetical protein VFB66_12095 [Tepidisphaeraceae bacterium]|nr:hypothetical protein [Tepidisphaeraceae bacterium]